LKLIVAILLCFTTISNGQGFDWKANKTSMAFTFLGGMSDGVRDASMFHFYDANDWWNGNESWKNKYKDYPNDMSSAYFGSKNILVWTTDAPHFFNMLTHQFNSFALVTYRPSGSDKFLHICRDAVIMNITRQAGHTLMYKVILK